MVTSKKFCEILNRLYTFNYGFSCFLVPQKLKIQNYDCFGENWVGFDQFKPITIVIGRNNSGKSRLFDLVETLTVKPQRENIRDTIALIAGDYQSLWTSGLAGTCLGRARVDALRGTTNRNHSSKVGRRENFRIHTVLEGRRGCVIPMLRAVNGESRDRT